MGPVPASLDGQERHVTERAKRGTKLRRSDDPDHRHIAGPCPPVALAQQLPVDPEPQPGENRVRKKTRTPAARVRADLEHRVDVVAHPQLVPVFDEPSAIGESLDDYIRPVGLAGTMVVIDPDLRGAACQQALGRGHDVTGQLGASGLPVLAVDRKGLTQVGDVRSAFHVEDHGDAHAIPH